MKKIALVGSTGSIGVQTLSVVAAHPDMFEICALVAHSSVEKWLSQVARFKPRYAALVGGEVPSALSGTSFYFGEEGALRAVEESGADIVVVACGGFAGLKYSLLALRMGARLALANKETLVCGGDIVMPLGGEIVPVDSEHSAIWQCLSFRRDAKFTNLIITASGGPFRNMEFSELEGVTAAQALAHPTWNMGAKITIDSATLLNKGYEVIEAHHLYAAPYDRIKTVIQPQSIVHSLVEFEDGALLAQMSYPTMEVPIQLALTYPDRVSSSVGRMTFDEPVSLTFEPLVRKRYPLYDLALWCGERGGLLPAALNAASEEAVHAFLRDKIGFCDIFRVADEVVSTVRNCAAESYLQLAEEDARCRAEAQKIIKKRYNGN